MTYTPEQIKDNRRKWVEALRSGKYEQGKSWLRNKDDKFCCLGVLADLVGCKWSRREYDGYWVTEAHTTSVPVPAREFVGLAHPHGWFGKDTSLAYHNDHGMSFADIADLIESEPAGLFQSAS